MEFKDVIQNRYSCKDFSTQQIEKEKLMEILEAGRVAPTAQNLQEQKIYVVQSKEQLDKIYSTVFILLPLFRIPLKRLMNVIVVIVAATISLIGSARKTAKTLS